MSDDRPGRLVLPAFAMGYFAMVTSSGLFGTVLPALSASLSVSTGAAGQLSALTPLTWAVLPLPAVVGIGFFNAFAQSLRIPAHLSLMSGASPERRGSLLGINATSNQAGLTTGAAAGGLLLVLGGYAPLGIACGVVSACAFLFYTVAWRKAGRL